MKKMYLVTNSDGYFAQQKYPWDSIDIKEIASYFSKTYDVFCVDFLWISRNFLDINGSIIIYTSSQRGEYKGYIEDIMYFLDGKNFLIPSIQALKAHENKGFQVLMARKLGLGFIPSEYYGDVKEMDFSYEIPYIIKTLGGASAQGVEKVNTPSDLMSFIREKEGRWTGRNIKRILKKIIFPKFVNQQRERYLDFGHVPIVIQKFVPNLQYDYKLLVFGGKYYPMKRAVAKNSFKASGSGLFSRDIDELELSLVLDFGQKFKSQVPSPHYSIDICIHEGEAYLIEYQLTHMGQSAITGSDGYYQRVDEQWCFINEKPNYVGEYCNALNKFIDIGLR